MENGFLFWNLAYFHLLGILEAMAERQLVMTLDAFPFDQLEWFRSLRDVIDLEEDA